MIEINPRAKPKPVQNPIALALGLHYVLYNGIVVLMSEVGPLETILGRPKHVLSGLSMTQNPAIFKVSDMCHGFWMKHTGLFCGTVNVEHPYHVKRLAEGTWNAIPSSNELYQYWKSGGELEWKNKMGHGPQTWKSYYHHAIYGVDKLPEATFNWHFSVHDIRKKP